jgi:hypothetical protein
MDLTLSLVAHFPLTSSQQYRGRAQTKLEALCVFAKRETRFCGCYNIARGAGSDINTEWAVLSNCRYYLLGRGIGGHWMCN